MKKLVDLLTFELENAFEKAGYDKQYAKVTLSNRPDLCEYQCNGAMAAVSNVSSASNILTYSPTSVGRAAFIVEP